MTTKEEHNETISKLNMLISQNKDLIAQNKELAELLRQIFEQQKRANYNLDYLASNYTRP